MRVLLIKPPMKGFMHEIGRHVPVGLAYLSAVLREAGHSVSIFDSLSFTEDNHVVAESDYSDSDHLKIATHPRWEILVHWGASWERIRRAIRESGADVVGISCMFSPYYESAYRVARMAKEELPGIRVVLGAQHGTVAPHHALEEPAIDLVVLGEGEGIVVDVLDTLASGAPFEDREGVAYRCGDGFCRCVSRLGTYHHVNPRGAFLDDLDALPFPDGDALSFAKYSDTTALITSRGCPYSCTFCTVHATVGKKFRARSPGNVVDEIQHFIANFGVRRFLIEDDNFTFDIPRVKAICEEIIRRGIDVELHLPNGITVVKLSEELATLMFQAGFRNLFLGLESTDTDRLKAIAKRFTSLGQVEEGVAWFARLGTDVSASLIVGLPDQDVAESARDVGNLLFRDIKFWSNPFYPIPGSPDYLRCIEQGTITEKTDYALFDQYNFSVGSNQLAPVSLYWTWVTTQAIAQWRAFVREGIARAEAGDRPTLEETVARLVEFARQNHTRADRTLEVPAEPIGARETTTSAFAVDVEPTTCFCALHGLQPHPSVPSTSPCIFTGDVMAAAASVYSGRSVHAKQVAARLLGAPTCSFELAEVSSAESEIFETFRRVLVEQARSLPIAKTARGSERVEVPVP